MGWFSERSLRIQWRFAQVVLAIPVLGATISLVVLVGMLAYDPAGP